MKLREFNSYTEMENIHQKEVNDFPFIWVFAFSNKEFIRKMAEEIKKRKPHCTGITTMEGIKRHVVSIGAGGFVFKEDVSAMQEMCKLHTAERKHFAETENNLVEMILHEMNNHEYGYTRDAHDTLMALGRTHDDFDTDEKFSRAWAKAQRKCFEDFDEYNS